MPRRKIARATDISELPAKELPELTGQQMEFVRGLLEGLSGADAYRRAYDTSEMLPTSYWPAASRLRNDPKISAWLDAARKAELGHCRITVDQHVRRLDRLSVIAIETGNVGAAVQAEQIIGKVLGHHVERYEDVTPVNPSAALEEIARLSPQVARELAQLHGVKLIEAKANEPTT